MIFILSNLHPVHMPKVETIFLIDDDADDREVFAGALSSVNPTITLMTAVDGVDALQKLKENFPQLPDVIFLDLNMPKMNGKQLLKELKNDTHFKFIPVFIYSTSSNNEDKRDTMGNGAADFIVKPNSYGELCKILEETTQSIQL